MAFAGSAALWLTSLSLPAQAYTISSTISLGCHERLTTEALRSVRAELAAAAPLPASRDERALIDDLPFELPRDLDDLGGATLLVAVRDNDLKGKYAADLAHLALIHGDPAAQREHCLRSPDQLEPDGSEAAVAACRSFIRERFEQALEGLDETGKPDLEKRTKLAVYLALRHRVEPLLPTFYVRMGQALHTMQDSFTHTFRSSDGMRIRTVGNWIDHVEGTLKESENGPAHRAELDHCEKLDAFREERMGLAIEAGTELLRAALAPEQTRAQKLAALDGLLDRYLSFEAGCSAANDWCGAPEREYGDTNAVKCSFADPVRDAGLWLAVAWLLLRGGRRRVRIYAALLCFALLGAARPCTAQVGGLMASSGDVERRRDHAEADGSELLLGGYLGVAGAVDHGALATTLGARLRFRKNWVFGFDAEWNPFISDPRVIYNADHFRVGVFNGYATTIFRLPLAHEDFNLRATLSLGFSTMLMDLYGAPSGSTGLYAAFTPLGLEWKMARFPYLIINPLGIALPAPQLSGVPFVYAQYRFSIGIELYGDRPPRWLGYARR